MTRDLFVRALDRLEQARTRSPRDAQIRRMLAQTRAARAEFLGRLGQLRESLDDWDRAMGLAADTDILAFRLGRATTLSLSSDYRAALAEAVAADRSIDDRANLRMTSALAHAVLSNAIRRDRSLTQDAEPKVSPLSSRRLSNRSATPGDHRPIKMPDDYWKLQPMVRAEPCCVKKVDL